MEFISIQLFLYVVVSFLVTYFIGHITVSFFKIPDKYPFLREFSKLVSASFIIITGYSIFKTGGISINIWVIFSGLFFLFWCKKKNYINTLKETKGIITFKQFPYYFFYQLLVLFFFFLFLLYKIKSPATGELYDGYGDFYNYSKIIQNLNKAGIESIFPDWYNKIPSNRSLYHFGELWQSAFYSTITNQPPFLAFYFQLFTIYLVVYTMGCCALIEVFIQPPNRFVYGFSILIIITSGISFFLPTNTFFIRGDWWNVSLTFQPKYFFSAVFIFYAILLTRLDKIIPLLLFSAVCVFVCNVIAPAVLLFTGFLLLMLLISKKISFTEFCTYALIPVFVVVAIGIYFLLINYLNSKNTEVIGAISSTPSVFLWIEYLKTTFNCFAGQLIKSALSLFLYIISFIIVSRADNKNINSLKSTIAVIFLIHIASLLSYAVFHDMVDAVQLWTNIYLPLSAIVSFLTIVYLINNQKILFKLIAAVLIILCFFQANIFQRFQKINLRYTEQVLQKYDGSASVFFKSKNEFTSVFSKNVNFYSPSAFFIMKYKEYNPVCLSVFDIPKSEEKLLQNAEDIIIHNSIFYKFVQLQKENQKFISVEQSQLDFIEKHNVKYAFTYLNSTLPVSVQYLVTDSIKDSMNGITFYKLK